jgi:hypothetical protein
MDPAEAAQDHALVQRLDTAVVHWTRQVKAVVNGKDDGAREDDGARIRVAYDRKGPSQGKCDGGGQIKSQDQGQGRSGATIL